MPEVLGFADQAPRNSLLEGLDGIGEGSGGLLLTQARRGLEWGTVELTCSLTVGFAYQ